MIEDGAIEGSGELHVEVTAGKAIGFGFVVKERLVIGRNTDGPGRLADDPELSRHHAEIARAANGEFTIKDLSSTNGTLVNGTLVTAAVVLGIGDVIEVGATTLVVRAAPAGAPAVPTDVDVRADTLVGESSPAPPRPGGQPRPQGGRRTIEVRLTVDFEEESAQLSVAGASEPIRLVLDHGRWRAAAEGS